MSFIITLTTQEGIVMASDSRITINGVRQVDGNTVIDPAVSQSDTSYKTFLAAGAVGISTFGAATVQGVPLSGYIDAFMLEKIPTAVSVEDIPPLLIAYMRSLPEVIDAGFHVAGYTIQDGKKVPYISRVFPINEKVENFVPTKQMRGVIWDGESDVMIRIIYQNLFLQDEKGKFIQLPNYGIPFDMFTLQDAIDFAVYAVRVTSDTMRFQLRYKTVGGPVDVLVIKPDGATWLRRKELYMDN